VLRGLEIADSYPNRYRICIGNYRLGIEVNGELIEVMRVLHRRDFYRYFP
jgi:mRNA-degrading endonuclease RelE of RelBE toxin-antitoxin system